MASHDEMIKAGFFDEKFKNTIRDYYGYGFKSYSDIGKSKSTIDADWVRLNNLLSGYFEWSEEKQKALFMSGESRSMKENPFHRVYRFCRYNTRDPKSFFNTVFALSDKVELAHGEDSLDLPEGAENEEGFFRLSCDVEDGRPLTSTQLKCFCSDGETPFDGDTNAINKRLLELKRLGILRDTAEKQPDANKAVHRWALADMFTDDILSAGEAVKEGFEQRLSDALDFFSSYAPLGAVGGFLRERFNPGHDSPFRFKHEFFMQAINDYNLIDLLDAMENRRWCRISYHNTLLDAKTVIICFPLGIKVSAAGGREYLVYYEPFKRSYSNLKLEFIDSIEWVEDNEIQLCGKKISLSDKQIQKDIMNAVYSSDCAWGASVPRGEGNAAKPAELKSVRIKMTYDPEKDGELLARLNREKRIGSFEVGDGVIVFTARVVDTMEMRPWLRSLYSRIIECSGMDEADFSFKADLDRIREKLAEDSVLTPPGQGKPPSKWEAPPEAECRAKEADAHGRIFNEFFSVYYRITADVLMELYSDTEREMFTRDELVDIIGKCIRRHSDSLGIKTHTLLKDELTQALTSGAFLRAGWAERKTLPIQGGIKNVLGKWNKEVPPHLKGSANLEQVYLVKYRTAEHDFYRRILPLTRLECRWLKSILGDKKIGLFLGNDEVHAIEDVLSDIRELPMDRIQYVDCRPNDFADKYIQELLGAIHGGKPISAVYARQDGSECEAVLIPIALEYSRREDIFRGCFCTPEGEVECIPLSQLKGIAVGDRSFDRKRALKIYDQRQNDSLEQVELEFYNVRGMTDRILCEFAPLKKECRYDRKSGIYSLKMFYRRNEGAEIAERLLGFGGDIKILSRDSRVFAECVSKISRQEELLRTVERVQGK